MGKNSVNVTSTVPAIWSNQFSFRVENGVAVIHFGVDGIFHAAVALPSNLANDMARQLTGVINAPAPTVPTLVPKQTQGSVLAP